MSECHNCLRNEEQAVLVQYPITSHYRDLFVYLEHMDEGAFICADCLKKEVRFSQRIKD